MRDRPFERRQLRAIATRIRKVRPAFNLAAGFRQLRGKFTQSRLFETVPKHRRPQSHADPRGSSTIGGPGRCRSESLGGRDIWETSRIEDLPHEFRWNVSEKGDWTFRYTTSCLELSHVRDEEPLNFILDGANDPLAAPRISVGFYDGGDRDADVAAPCASICAQSLLVERERRPILAAPGRHGNCVEATYVFDGVTTSTTDPGR
jgi:hypothetical protein